MDNPALPFIASSILYNFLFCALVWTIYGFLFPFSKKEPGNKIRFLTTTLLILLPALISFAYDYLFSAFTKDVLTPFDVISNKKPYFLILRGLLVSGLFYFIYFYLQVSAEKQKSQIEVEQLKQAQLAANLSTLKEQLSPHFLFNTLNTLSSLTQDKNVKDFVAELANVYRYVLQYKELDTATLEQEIHFIESYLYIIKTRLENAIDVTNTIDPKVAKSKIPPLTLQLLIENAIKHNIASGSKPLRIRIENTDNQFITISNNYQPKNSIQASTGIGLSNVMQRYQLLFKKEILIDKNPDFFSIKLPVI